ncbi:flavin-binding monooxygenase-like domain-containing protein [Sarocladium implicatum]|nr:flavin-binding monooxygenase-like domain-containing protein [Sarocladium implicatum]
MEGPNDSPHVAVIGAGVSGLAMMKSLLEEGLRVTAFDERDGPGGIWRFTEDPSITSVTTRTRVQLSKFLTPFTDFPHSPGTSRYPTGKELGEYYQQYAEHFGLSDKIEYRTKVKFVSRDGPASKWLVHLKGEETPRQFDKVVLATGSSNVPKWPKVDNIEAFKGTYIHGKEYKRPEDFTSRNVIVLGQGNSAGDCAVELTSHAARVHIAHHRGAMIVSRTANGARFDRFASWKLTRLMFWLEGWLPSVYRWLTHKAFSSAHSIAFGKLDPAWGFDSEYLYATNIQTIMMNDGIVAALKDRRLISTPGVVRITGPKQVQLSDGSMIDDVDTIIACTGYDTSLKLLGDDAIEFSKPAPDIRELPRLFHNVFPIDYPDSLACLNNVAFVSNVATNTELASMAIAQIWAGKSSLPPRADMEQQIQNHASWFTRQCRENAPILQLDGLVEPRPWNEFILKAAGVGLNEHLGWSMAGIKFSLLNPKLYLLMAYGVCTPHLYRYFETGKRKAWPGAREAIERVNRESAEDSKRGVEEWKATKQH